MTNRPTASPRAGAIGALVLAIALLMTAPAAWAAAARGILAHASGDQQWIVQRLEQAPSAAGDPRQWAVLMRDRSAANPRLVQLTTTLKPPAQLATYGKRLVILHADGSWTLAWDQSQIAGPSLPDGWRAIAVAADAGNVGFLAEQVATATSKPVDDSAQLALFRYDGSAFKLVRTLALPAPRDPKGEATLFFDRDRAFIALTGDGRCAVHVLETRSDAARQWPTPIDAADAWWADDERGQTFLVTRAGDGLIMHRIGDAGPQTSIPLPLPAGVVRRELATSMVQGELHVAWVDNGKLFEQVFAAEGKPIGQAAAVQAPLTPGSAGLFERTVSLVGTAAMLIVLLATGRQTYQTYRATTIAPPRPAPLARRLAAGLVDGVPLYAAVAYAIASDRVRIVSGLTYPTGYAAYVILGGGVVLYLSMTFLCEWRWQRTPGKFLFGLRLATVTGVRPSTRAIFIRNLLRLLDLQLITLLIVPLTTLRQRLGDFLAATMVVDDAEAPASPTDRPQDRRGSADQ